MGIEQRSVGLRLWLIQPTVTAPPSVIPAHAGIVNVQSFVDSKRSRTASCCHSRHFSSGIQCLALHERRTNQRRWIPDRVGHDRHKQRTPRNMGMVISNHHQDQGERLSRRRARLHFGLPFVQDKRFARHARGRGHRTRPISKNPPCTAQTTPLPTQKKKGKRLDLRTGHSYNLTQFFGVLVLSTSFQSSCKLFNSRH